MLNQIHIRPILCRKPQQQNTNILTQIIKHTTRNVFKKILNSILIVLRFISLKSHSDLNTMNWIPVLVENEERGEDANTKLLPIKAGKIENNK